MKKTYSKPKMFAESFALAAQIAKCDGVNSDAYTFQDRYSCAYHMGNNGAGQAVFNAGVVACDLPIDAEEYGTDCYNGPFLEDTVSPFGGS